MYGLFMTCFFNSFMIKLKYFRAAHDNLLMSLRYLRVRRTMFHQGTICANKKSINQIKKLCV